MRRHTLCENVLRVAHIYISALLFSPGPSRIYSHYQPISGGTIDILTGALQDWPVYSWMLRGHSGRVASVAFSPDGQQIVSGSHDGTICFWDASNSLLVGSSLKVNLLR
jgi:WD40 repeat protein